MRATQLVRLFSCLLPVAALALAACSDDPTESGTGDAARIETNREITFQEAGRQFAISAWVRDARGNRLAEPITATSSGASIRVDSVPFNAATSETRIFITPLGLDTTAYVVISGAGLTDTVYVRSLPAALAINLPTTLGSGASATPTVNALSSTGTVIATNVKFTVTSSDTNKVKVNADGSVTARGTGLATLTFRGPGGQITATKDVTVVPGAFAGTITAQGAAQGGNLVTITAPAGVSFDTDTQVRIGAATNFQMLISRTATEIVALIPFGTPAGATTVALTNVGAQQLAFEGTLNVASTVTNESGEPNDDAAHATPVTFPVDVIGLVNGTDVDDVYKLVLTQSTPVNINLTWDNSVNHDLDFLFMSATTPGAPANPTACWAASAASPETKSCTMAAGTYYLWVNNYEAVDAGTSVPVTYRLRITPQ